MKTTFIALFFLCATVQLSLAQHALQADDGSGHYSLIKGSVTGGIYTLQNGGGTIITTGGGLLWLTAGNILTGGLPTTPNEIFGSTNNFDVVMQTNGVEQLRLRVSGGINLPATAASGVGGIFQNGVLFLHSFGAGNFFAGQNAGNLAMGGVLNTGVGFGALKNN